VLEPAVDRFGRPVGGAGSVEVGQHVRGSALEGPSERGELGQGGRDAGADGVDEPLHRRSASAAVGVAVGGDHPLVDPPGRLDLDVLLGIEQPGEPLSLLVGEQIGAGVQGPAGGVERIVLPAAVAVEVLLHAAPTPVKGVAGEADDVKGVHHRGRVGQLFGGGGLEAGEPVHCDDLHAVAPGCRPLGQPLLERALGAAFDHVEQPSGAGAVPHRGEVDDDGDVLVALVARAGVPPDVLVDADHADAVEPAGVFDQGPTAFGQYGVVGGVPRDPEAFGDAGDGQVLADDPFQRPPQPPAGQLRACLGRPAGVLAPHVPAPAAPVAADRDQQHGRPPAQRLVRQPPPHRVPRAALATAAAAPPLIGPLGLDDPAGQHRPVGLDALPDHLQAELVEACERRQVRASEGSVRHVEVFPVGSVRTPILGRPRHLPRQRRAAPPHPDDFPAYTFNCEEPANLPPTLRGPRTATFPYRHESAQVRQVRPGKVVERGPLSGRSTMSGLRRPTSSFTTT
jgi:hypothetical protein